MRVLLLTVVAVTLVAGQPLASIELPGKEAPVLARRRGLHGERNQRLIDAVSFAYKADPLRIVAPDWFYEAGYDFVVDAGDGPPEPVLRKALEEKFALIAGWETRPIETWVLERLPSGAPLTLAATGRGGSLTGSSGMIRGTGSLETLARFLRHILKTEVVDETGTGGYYQFSISWSPGDDGSLTGAFRDAGLDLHREYRDSQVLVIYSAYWPDAPKPPRYACEPRPALKSPIEALPPYDLSLPFDRRFTPRRTLVEEYPEDIFAGMAAQAAFRDRPELTAEWAWALRHYERMQDRVAAAFLEARLLMKVQPARSLALLTKILDQEPDFGWAYVSLAEVAGTQRQREAALRRFREICPGSLADAPLYDRVHDPELLRLASDAFARILAGPIDATALAAYPHYWRIRRRARQPAWPSNWLELDLARIRALDLTADPAWVSALEAGYELIGDQASLTSLRRHIEATKNRR